VVAHKLRQSAAGQEFMLTVKASNSTGDPKDRFDLPDDIKALVNKK